MREAIQVSHEYKVTELGEIPESWTVAKISEIAETRSGGTPDRQNSANFGGSIPWVKSGELEDRTITVTEESLTEEGLANSNARVFPAGTLLVALYGATAGKVGKLSIDASTNQAVCAVLPNSRVFVDYLFFAFMFRRIDLLGQRYGGAQPNLSQTLLREFKIVLPTLREQEIISSILSSIQQAKEKTEAVIEAAKALKQSLMKHLFTYGPVSMAEAEKVPLKKTEIGEIPESWQIIRLEEVAREAVKNGAFIKREDFGSGTLFLNVADTYRATVADLRRVERVRCSDGDLSLYGLRSGDLIFVRSSLKREGVGQCCIIEDLEEPAIYDCHLMRVRLDQRRAVPKFLAYYFNTDQGKKALVAHSKTTTMTTINQRGLATTNAPSAAISAQSAIVEILSQIERKIESEKSKKQSIDALFKTLLRNLMTGKIRVPAAAQKAAEVMA